MRLFIEPPLSTWPVAAAQTPARREMAALIEDSRPAAPRPGRLGVEGWDSTATGPVIATGHQAWLWHPGILVKDIAAAVAARRGGGTPLHVVVDHDTHPALQLDLPVIRQDCLAFETLILVPQSLMQSSTVPAGCQPAVDPAVMRATLEEARQRLGRSLAVDLGPLLSAIPDRPFASLARQVSAIIAALAEPLTGPIPRFYATDLAKLDSFRHFCRTMARDARACVAAYNQAAAAKPEAGVPALRVEPDKVELPLWLLQWNQPRQRVFADYSRGGTGGRTGGGGRMVDEQGRELGAEAWLAPRALALTAFLRSECCDLFIHGKGGAVYDQVMESWWQQWAGRALGPATETRMLTPAVLAPRVLASADLCLNLPAPVADDQAVARARWWAHHLPHNLDRALHLDGPAAARKRELLNHMNDDRDRPRRAAAFAEIHQLNQGWAAKFAPALAEARVELERALAGRANRTIARRRDWFFGLYQPEQLAQLRDAVVAAAGQAR